MAERIFIFGCGGHAKIVHDIIDAGDQYEAAGYVDADINSASFNGLPLYEEAHFLENFSQENVVVAIGKNSSRKRIFQNLTDRGFHFPNIIHPSAILSKNTAMAQGSVVMPNVAVNSSTRIGNCCVLNTAVVVEHDCILDDFVSLCPKVIVSGICHVGEGVYVGSNASVIHSIKISEWSIVASQAGVISDVPAHSLVAGVPAKLIKKIEKGHKLL